MSEGDRSRTDGVRPDAVRLAPDDLAEAVALAERFRLLARADNLLHRTLDYGETLETLAQLVVDSLADFCVIDVLDVDGHIQRMARGDDAVTDLLDETERFPLDPGSATPAAHVLRTGEVLLQRRLDDETLRQTARSEEHHRLILELEPRSSIIVPLTAHDQKVGVMTLARRADPAFDEDDLELARELGLRGGLAILNAQLYRAAQAANRAKSNFLSVMSHELRTPLSAIIGYADLLEHGIDGALNDAQMSKVARIKSSSNHLLQLIEEILAFANQTGAADGLRLRETTVAQVVGDVVAVADPLARGGNVEFRVSSLPDNAVIRTDPRKLRQILLNLVSNGIKFTEQGTVELAAWLDGDDVCFSVRDTGIGIDRDRLEAIFEPFWQVEDPMTRKAGGTGLGLSLARSFAQLLGGDITVESEPGRGSIFNVRLPRHLPHSTAARQTADVRREALERD